MTKAIISFVIKIEKKGNNIFTPCSRNVTLQISDRDVILEDKHFVDARDHGVNGSSYFDIEIVQETPY
jgi:hypothetical protein